MRMVQVGVLGLAVAGLMAGPVSAQGRRGRGLSPFELAQQGWLASYEQGQRLARQTGKPIMLVFRCVP
jgi:hypothetical protein